jgi:NDP-sugar pyrophosphorylase family protein
VNIAEIPVFVLCGGLGTRLKEMTEFRPKPMVPIGPHPMLLHIMDYYSGLVSNDLSYAWAIRANAFENIFSISTR